jgi:nucleoporin NUP42
MVRQDIQNDLTNDRPLWPLGCYGPGTERAPKQLIEGELEQSPEEVRIRAYMMLAQGQQEQIVGGNFQTLITITN